jgi:hypothetical protein
MRHSTMGRLPTRVGELHLGGGPDAVRVRFLQAPEDVLQRGRRGRGLDRPGEPHREHPPRMQRLAPAGEWMAGAGRVPTRAIACSTVPIRVST